LTNQNVNLWSQMISTFDVTTPTANGKKAWRLEQEDSHEINYLCDTL